MGVVDQDGVAALERALGREGPDGADGGAQLRLFGLEGVVDGGVQAVSQVREPVAASMAAMPKPVAIQGTLSFEFNGESWTQFYAPDGSTLEKGLMKAGERKDFAAGQLGRVVVGNASEVRLLRAGQPVDMGPWLRSNVARFAVSSDGSPVAPAE